VVRQEQGLTMAKAGYALDTSPSGFGLISLAYHACAVHSEPETDHLYLVIDANAEPTDVLLPTASTAVVGDGKTIYTFDGDDSSQMVFRWRGKLNLMPWPTTFQLARVRGADYVNLVFNTYADGVLIDQQRVTNGNLFKLPALDSHESYEFEFVGTSTVRTGLALQHASEVE
jgi:hypothetical protein